MLEDFPDRSNSLFGREIDLRLLTDRARNDGLSVITARPLMGKSWVLQEMARRLVDEGSFIVGYHEYKGGETSHLLRAVANLYEHWLSDSSMRDQAQLLWQQNKNSLVPKVGKLVGTIFETLGCVAGIPETVGTVVRDAFDKLSESATDLKTGGLKLAPLPYDQALSLVSLVASISTRRPILILDAWESAVETGNDYSTICSFIKHIEAWNGVHIFLAIRYPNQSIGDQQDHSNDYARNLMQLSPDAVIYELQEMNLSVKDEAIRLCRYAKTHVPATRNVSDSELLEMISGYPGVINHWMSATKRSSMRNIDDLRYTADDAQNLRFTELHHLLSGLSDQELRFMCRIASLVRLDQNGWESRREVILGEFSQALMYTLISKGVLEDADYATLGHETRHAATRRWLAKNRRSLFKAEAQTLIESMATRCTFSHRADVPFLESLAAAASLLDLIQLDNSAKCLISAARSLFGDDSGLLTDEFIGAYQNLVDANKLTIPLVCIALNNRAFAVSKKGDLAAAIAGYSIVIELPYAPVREVAHALYSRGVSKVDSEDLVGGIADYTAVVELTDAPIEWTTKALNNRGLVKPPHEGIIDLNSVIALPNAPVDQVAIALYNRGCLRKKLGDIPGSVDDYTTMIRLPNPPVEWLVRAFVNRGVAKGLGGDETGAIADFTAVIELPNSPAEWHAKALCNRGYSRFLQSDLVGSSSDFTSAIDLAGAEIEQIASALYNRGWLKSQQGDVIGSIKDYSTLIGLPNGPVEWTSKALINRSELTFRQGDALSSILDLTRVIELPNVPVEEMAKSLCLRAQLKEKQQDLIGAIDDYSVAMKLSDAPKNVTVTAEASFVRLVKIMVLSG